MVGACLLAAPHFSNSPAKIATIKLCCGLHCSFLRYFNGKKHNLFTHLKCKTSTHCIHFVGLAWGPLHLFKFAMSKIIVFCLCTSSLLTSFCRMKCENEKLNSRTQNFIPNCQIMHTYKYVKLCANRCDNLPAAL